MSVFGTKVAPSPFSLAGGKAAFGGMRGSGPRGGFDDEDEEEDGKQKVELKENPISLEQVNFSSCWLLPGCRLTRVLY